jgi:hypothetical protein
MAPGAERAIGPFLCQVGGWLALLGGTFAREVVRMQLAKRAPAAPPTLPEIVQVTNPGPGVRVIDAEFIEGATHRR